MSLTKVTRLITSIFPLQTADIADSAITSAKIAAGAVATADLADGAVTSAKLDAACNAPTATKFASAPAFSAIASTTQAVTTATNTKVNLGSEEYDTHNCFDTTLSRFTPTVSGYYQINGNVTLSSGAQVLSYIYKNGAAYRSGSNILSGGSSSVSVLVYMNGTTDYLELWGLSGTTQNLSAGSYLQGVLVKPA